VLWNLISLFSLFFLKQVAFNDFIHHYVTLDVFKADFLPTIERLCLRAPEIVFACKESSATLQSVFVLQVMIGLN
jgi:hypothetical protein